MISPFQYARFLAIIFERHLSGSRIGPLEVADDYDAIASSYRTTWLRAMGCHSAELLALAHIPLDASVLDLGCGSGHVLDVLAEKGFRGGYTGVDLSPEMLGRFSREATRVCADAAVAVRSFPDGHFDAVTCLWSMEYFSKKEMLGQIRRVLRPGGRCVVLANRRGTIDSMEKAFLRLMARNPKRIVRVADLALRLPGSSASLARVARRVGLEVDLAQDDEASFTFSTARDAVEWCVASGALAGTFRLMDMPDWKEQLAACLPAHPNGSWRVTHRFAALIARAPC